jgi:chorismate synthase
LEILGGPLFAVAGAGESHGPAITTIVFGTPAGTPISRDAIQGYLDRRRPGSNKHGTPRREDDTVLLVGGVYSEDHDALLAGPQVAASLGAEQWATASYGEGVATGEPIAAVVLSTTQRSGDYTQFSGAQGEVRPGHTDLVKHWKSRGFVDVRGGGRSSYRSTISDVIGGSIARAYLQQHFGTILLSNIVQVGPLRATVTLADRLQAALAERGGEQVDGALAEGWLAQMAENVIYSLDAEFAAEAGELIKQTRIAGDSLGAALEVVAINPPALVGEPLYNSLKVRLMGALGGLHAVQGVEIGAGAAVAARKGSENNDPIRHDGYQGNNHGGLLGGITTGMPLQMRVTFKPTSTITLPQQSVRKNLDEIDFQVKKGRHDPCVGVRAGVTLESRMAIEVMNAVLMQQSSWHNGEAFKLFGA